MKDVAGVYQTLESKEPIEGTRAWHKSSKWILDLSEGGSFTLNIEVFRVPTQDKKYSPIPVQGTTLTGYWNVSNSKLELTVEEWTDTIKKDVGNMVFNLESNSDLVHSFTAYAVTESELDLSGFNPDFYLMTEDIKHARFHKLQ